MTILSENRFFRPLVGPTIATIVALAILIGLGTWQIERLHWKLGLIANITHRMAAPPSAPPAEDTWSKLDLKTLEYHHLKLQGHFLNKDELYYFTQNDDGEPGFDIITPFVLDSGATVLVDRGYVPEANKLPDTRAEGQIEGETTLTGVARAPQTRGYFSAPDDIAKNMWFTRDPAKMGAALKLSRVAPFYVEADATPNVGGLPVGGRTQVHIRNEHLQYAITWYGLALVLFVIYFVYHWNNGRIGRPANETKES